MAKLIKILEKGHHETRNHILKTFEKNQHFMFEEVNACYVTFPNKQTFLADSLLPLL